MRKLIKRMLLSCVLLIALWLSGLTWFVAQIPTKPTPVEKADAIVVLTGGSGRLETGIGLLLEEKGRKLFVSGAHEEVSYQDIIRLSPKEDREFVRHSTGWKIILGSNAENTIGNAQEIKQWLDITGYRRILLVTSHYHMPRSLSEFTELMPEHSFIPVAVIPKETENTFWWLNKAYRNLILSEYYKYLISKLRHWAIHNVFTNNT